MREPMVARASTADGRSATPGISRVARIGDGAVGPCRRSDREGESSNSHAEDNLPVAVFEPGVF